MSWLLLRGLSREKRHWGSFPTQLGAATGERVLCLDLPGFGTEYRRRSPSSIARIGADLRERFMSERGSEEGSERWSILGISLGGMIALEWCARHPEDFVRCVTVNTSARPSSPFERFRPAGLRTIVTTLTGDALKKERGVLALTSDAGSASLDALARKQVKWALECPPSKASVALQLRAAMTFEVPSDVRTPVLVLASRADRLVSHRCSERIAEQLGAPLRLHDRGGHDLALDEPAWICEEIVR